MTSSLRVPEPGALAIDPGGALRGRTGSYELIADAGGMSQLVVTDGGGGWTTRANSDHTGYRAAP
ncbi:MAG TPA: hypothetical protein VNO83_01720 [Pseudonocardia sp.]|nr:hypothetical protein [Pseudonocardia sp.]